MLDKNAIIVLGGSFNPPTVAHEALMAHALDRTGAGTGLFVPSSHAYVARKASRQRPGYVFSEAERADMLAGIARHDPRFAVDTCEYGDDGRGHTYETMCRIRKNYPGRTCCFLTGADKLRIIPRWHSAEKFMSEFTFVVTSRAQSDAERMIAADPRLARFKDSFVVIPELDMLSGVSSSRFQALYEAGNPDASAMAAPGTMRIVNAHFAKK